MTTTIPWFTEPPTFEQVKAHAAAHPCRDYSAGLWLIVPVVTGALPHVMAMTVDDDRGRIMCLNDRVHPRVWFDLHNGHAKLDGLRWLPCTADGVPVAMAEMLAEIARDYRHDREESP